MSRRDQGLAERRQELIERSAAQRQALIADAEPLLQKAAALDRIVAQVRSYPVLTVAVAGAVTFFGSRKLFDLVTRVITLYALFRR